MSDGWWPSWRWPVVAAAVIMSFIIALLVFIMIISLKHQSWLLEEMVRGYGERKKKRAVQFLA